MYMYVDIKEEVVYFWTSVVILELTKLFTVTFNPLLEVSSDSV